MSITQENRSGHDMRGVLLDLDGVVYIGKTPVPGSFDAIARLRAAGVPIRFITNTTRRPRSKIVSDLAALGLEVATQDVFTPAVIARAFLARQDLTPFLVIHPELREDFRDLPRGSRSAVVLGDAGAYFTYDLLNEAYRRLLHGAEFLALAKNRTFMDGDGELSLDVGAFVAGLEYACRRQATVLGKPAASFFQRAVEELSCDARHVVMIGDDAEADVAGAMAAGLMGVLVKTGKYRAGQEHALAKPPTLVAQNLKAAVDLLLR